MYTWKIEEPGPGCMRLTFDITYTDWIVISQTFKRLEWEIRPSINHRQIRKTCKEYLSHSSFVWTSPAHSPRFMRSSTVSPLASSLVPSSRGLFVAGGSSMSGSTGALSLHKSAQEVFIGETPVPPVINDRAVREFRESQRITKILAKMVNQMNSEVQEMKFNHTLAMYSWITLILCCV